MQEREREVNTEVGRGEQEGVEVSERIRGERSGEGRRQGGRRQ